MKMTRALAAALLATTCGLASAHYPWFQFDAVAGAPPAFRIGWGHHFPSETVMAADRLASLAVVGARGSTPLALAAPDGRHLLPAELRPGAALLVGLQQAGYYSRTPEGGRRGSRKDFPAARSCAQSHNSFKALIGDDAAAARALGHRFELLPLAGAGTLKAGGALPVQLLWQGRPWQGELTAIYAGYQKAQGEADYPVTLKTDAEGKARVPLDRAGLWMVRAGTSEPYPDPATCDQLNYHVSLTFAVR